MIVGLEGIVEKKEPTFIHLNINGVIYEVNISINTSNSIKDKKVKLLITQIIREDANLLFGLGLLMLMKKRCLILLSK